MNFRSNFTKSSMNIWCIAIFLGISCSNRVGGMPQGWTYPGLWVYSTLPNLYNFRRHAPIPISQPQSQTPSHRAIPSKTRNVPSSSMIRDRCEPKNWGNLVGKCRMSCNLYDGSCTETLITTDCGCSGELNVK